MVNSFNKAANPAGMPADRRKLADSAAFVVVATVFWIVLLAWLGWLYHSERVYAREYLGRLAARAALPVYTPGDVVTWRDDKKLLFSGWSVPEANFRWSGSKKAVFLFRLPPGWNRQTAYRLKMHFLYSIHTQRVTVLVNKHAVGAFTLQGAALVDVGVPGELLHDANVVELLLPDAVQPGTQDFRVLAVAMLDFVLQPVDVRISKASESIPPGQ